MEQNTPSTAFVNPADSYNRARVADNYLWQVARKLVGYRFQAPGVDVDQAVTVVRIVIARDGRLLDVSVAQSSGLPQLDAGVVQGVRRGSPYAPLPESIQGASASFILPLVSVSGT
jgi:protein TonB